MSDDKVHPSTKPITNNNPSKPQLYGTARPRNFHTQHNRDRNICCNLCCYLFLILFFLLVLFVVVVTGFYLLFHPKPPSFTLTSLTTTSSSSFDLTLSAINPNSKISFSYQPASISILAGDTTVAGGLVPAFEQGERNTTVLVASIESSGTTTTMAQHQNDAVLVKIVTKVEAKIMGVLRTPRVGVTVLCDGVSVKIHIAGNKKMAMAVAAKPMAAEPAVEANPMTDVAAEPTAATVKTAGCGVDVRFKVLKWIV